MTQLSGESLLMTHIYGQDRGLKSGLKALSLRVQFVDWELS